MNPLKALRASQKPTVTEEDKEAPLSPQEVTRLKAAFRFLKEHRQLLKLRVNAHEDLLLNGKREPTHRGVCQHLLAKVDKPRVLQASERLPAVDATRLLAGVIRFAPELPYLLRFLECVRASAGQEKAATALTQALSNIDFEDASEAQIRQLLVLICDVFPERQLPVFLLGLLQSAPFRKAFDRSADDFPPALATLLVPLREVHRLIAVSNKRHAQVNPALLSQGALLLLRVNHESLLGLNSQVRKKLFLLLGDLEAQTQSNDSPPSTKALLALYESLQFSSNEVVQATLILSSQLLQAGNERAARQVLHRAVKAEQGTVRAELEEHLSLLDQPRIGPFALKPPSNRTKRRREQPSKSDNPPGEKPPFPPPHRFYNAVNLHNQRKARVLYVAKGQELVLGENLEAWRSVLLPQVQLPMEFDVTSGLEHPFVAVEHLGDSLTHQLRHASRGSSRRFLLDLCRLKAVLDASGVDLPDGHLGRFSVDSAGNVWLSDLSDMNSPSSSNWLKDALLHTEKVSSFSFSEEERKALDHTDGPLDVARALRLI